ncbi:MAG: DUF3618 domain-containing protein [Anaerolineae bacterium]|nr:DUF3618 domain-containing protein [Anaerolineae bacterium]
MKVEPTRPYPSDMADDPQVIRAQIEQTRAQMGQTLDEIQMRLTPDYIKQQAQDTIREATVNKVEEMTQRVNNWRSSAVQTIKENPIPAAMVGIGMGWLLLTNGHGRDEDYAPRYREDYEYDTGRFRGDAYSNSARVQGGAYYRGQYDEASGPLAEAQNRVSQTGEDAKQWVNETTEQAKDKVKNVAANVQQQASTTAETLRENIGEAASQAQEYAAETAGQARESAAQARVQAQQQMVRAKRSFWHIMEENPMVIGAAAVAVGALVGAALPGTEKENALMGRMNDRFMEETSATVQETMHKVQAVAEQAAHTAVDEAKREADKQNLPTLPTAEIMGSREPRVAQSNPSVS